MEKRINIRRYSFLKVDIEYYFLFILTLILSLVFIPGFGIEINGYRRSLDFWFFSIQPSEFVKLALIVLFCDNLDRKYKDNKHIKNILFPSFLALCVVAVLIFLEPDLSSVVVIGLIMFIVLFAGGVRFKHLFGLGFIGFIVTAGFLLSEDYQRERLLAFLSRIIGLFNGKGEIGEVNFQISQSLIALGSGNLTGVGLGNSIQKYSYLPEAHTDFIFAIIGEELGLLGTILVSMIAAGMLLNISRQNALPPKNPELSGYLK